MVEVPNRGRGSVAATSGAQGLAPGVGADDGAAASGCGVRRASTSTLQQLEEKRDECIVYRRALMVVISTMLISE